MEYETLRTISGTLGLIIFVSLFVGVLAYALWPKNRKKFDHAAHIPLNDNNSDSDAGNTSDDTTDNANDNSDRDHSRGGSRG